MEITRARPGDIPALKRLLHMLFSRESEFTPDPEAQARGLLAIIENPEIGDILVACEPGKVIGMVNILYTLSTALGGPVAVFEDMIVAADARNAGAGSALLSHAIEWASHKGCRRISLLADGANTGAHRFYLRHGFSRSDMVTFRRLLQS